MKKSFLSLIVLFFSIIVHAGVVEIDGIYYQLDNDKNEARVNGMVDVQGFYTIVIPETIEYGNNKYTVTSIRSEAFQNKDIHTVHLPNSITQIGVSSFSNCVFLSNIDFGLGLETIGSWAFNHCLYLKNIELNHNVKSVGDNAFLGCTGLSSVVLSDSISEIKQGTFQGCSNLESVTWGKNIKKIGAGAFYETGFKKIIIPNSVTSIERSAFSHNKKLEEVYCFPEKVPVLGEDVFYNSNIENSTLYVPENSIIDYKNSAQWNGFGKIEALSTEDNNNQSNDVSIVGKWELTTGSSVHTHVEFKSNGTFSYTSTQEADYEEHGTYKIEDDWLYQKFSDEESWGKSKILLMNPMSLVLQDYKGDETDGKPYSYIKVNPAPATKADSKLIGKWEHTTNDGSLDTHLELKEDGTFIYTSTNDPSYKEEGTYRVEGNVLYQMFSDEDDWCLNLILLSNPMSLTIQEYNGIEVDGKPCGYIKVNPEPPTSINPLIIGKWELTSNNSNVHTHVEFKEDGTFCYTSTNDATYEEHGTFRVEDNILYQMFSDEDDWCLSKITVLNETSLSVVELRDDAITTSGNEDSYKKIAGSGINTILRSEGGGKMFTITGREISTPTKGINIIKQKDGVIKKVVVK